MSDAIELLEAIGQNASLRHASAERLAHALEEDQGKEDTGRTAEAGKS